MSEQDAKNFFDKLESDNALKATVKKSVEDIAAAAGYPGATEQDLTKELAARWKTNYIKFPYSEPPGF